MSDEEKKAINSIKRELECEQTRDNYKILIGLYKNVEIEILLNLIEKQQKEIEELKDIKKELTERVLRLESDKFWDNVVSKNKIKAKIEETEKDYITACETADYPNVCVHNLIIQSRLEVLQSLLEKE